MTEAENAYLNGRNDAYAEWIRVLTGYLDWLKLPVYSPRPVGEAIRQRLAQRTLTIDMLDALESLAVSLGKPLGELSIKYLREEIERLKGKDSE